MAYNKKSGGKMPKEKKPAMKIANKDTMHKYSGEIKMPKKKK